MVVMPQLARLCGIVAAIGFAIAFAVHCLTFAQIDVQTECPLWWLPHLGCFFVFIPFGFASRSESGPKPAVSQLWDRLPGWAGVILVVVIVYAAINFGLFMLHTEGGTPSESNGVFVLQSHGKVIRHLTETQYQLQRNYVVRGFSGHWLVFYLVPALYFLARTPASRPN